MDISKENEVLVSYEIEAGKLKGKRKRRGVDKVSSFLAKEYKFILYVNMDTDSFELLWSNSEFEDRIVNVESFTELVKENVEEKAKDGYRTAIKNFLRKENIVAKFEGTSNELEMVFELINGEWVQLKILPDSDYHENKSEIIVGLLQYTTTMQQRFDNIHYNSALYDSYDIMILFDPEKKCGNVLRFDGEKLVINEDSSNIINKNTVGRLVHPEDFEKVIECLRLGTVRKCFSRGKVEQYFEIRVGIPEKYKWYSMTVRYYKEYNRYKVLIMVKNIDNVRSVLEEKERLNETSRRQQEIIRKMSDVYYCVCYLRFTDNFCMEVKNETDDNDGFFNGTFKQELLERYADEFVHPADKKELLDFFDRKRLVRAFDTENSIRNVDIRRKFDGIYEWVRISVQPVKFFNGELAEAIVSAANINEEKKKEIEDTINRQRLARILEAQNQALSVALKAAESANGAKTQFLTSMSHDLRTPMNAIMGMTYVMQQNMGDMDTIKDCIEKITISSENMLNLINDVLDMSRIESGKIELHEKPYNIKRLVEEIDKIIRCQCEGKKQKFKVILKDRKLGEGYVFEENADRNMLGNAYMDVVRMRQILANILSNAMKYTPAGGSITFMVTRKDKSHDGKTDYVFEVADTGIGMKKEFLDNIFSPFERDEKVENENIEGTGLGMSIVKKLVDVMQGEIKITSTENVGTRVWIRIPLRECEKCEENYEDNCGNISNISLAASRVLVVEDNEINRIILKEILKGTKIAVEEAVNGEEAVRMVKNSPEGYYDIIFMDIRMPVLSGDAATRSIRKLDREDVKKLPIIAVSANAFDEEINKSISAGMNDYITKPLKPQEVLRMIGKWIIV